MPREERERLILECAGQIFARGYHSAPMDEIAELAGISKPMLYAYFGSKEGLYVAYIDRTGRELLARIIGAAAADDPPRVALRKRIMEFLAFVEEHSDGWSVLFQEISSIRPLADEVAGLRAELAAAVRDLAENTVSRSAPWGIDRPASDAVAHAIVGAGESLANWWLAHPEIPREHVAEWYAQVVQASLGAVIGHSSTKGRP